jgi:FeS assembly SUF system protein
MGIFNFRGKKTTPEKSKPSPGDEAPPPPSAGDLPAQELEAQVIEALRTVYDPEIPVNIHELGLVYKIDISAGGDVVVSMTLTSPMCPVAGSLPPEVEYKVLAIPGVTSARVELVWDPPWNPGMMTEAAKLQLGMF